MKPSAFVCRRISGRLASFTATSNRSVIEEMLDILKEARQKKDESGNPGYSSQ